MLFGFLTWKLIKFLSLDRLYTAWWFVILLLLFGSSLLACTFTTQLPSIKLLNYGNLLINLDNIKVLVLTIILH